MKNIILLAPPAAGKGTQAKRIHDFYQIPHISLGEIMRHARDDTTEVGKVIIACQDARKLVPLSITLRLIYDRIQKDDCKNGYVLDGFPRTIEQALAYEKMLSSLGQEIGHVFFLDIDKDLALKRTLGRLICPNCGDNYNVHFPLMCPLRENICNRCHHTLVKRSDDTAEIFEKGFQTYMESTAGLIEYYKEKGLLREIPITEKETPDGLFQKIKEILDYD